MFTDGQYLGSDVSHMIFELSLLLFLLLGFLCCYLFLLVVICLRWLSMSFINNDGVWRLFNFVFINCLHFIIMVLISLLWKVIFYLFVYYIYNWSKVVICYIHNILLHIYYILIYIYYLFHVAVVLTYLANLFYILMASSLVTVVVIKPVIFTIAISQLMWGFLYWSGGTDSLFIHWPH